MPGSLVWSACFPWDFDGEFVTQFGDFGGLSHRAYAIHLGAGVKLESHIDPEDTLVAIHPPRVEEEEAIEAEEGAEEAQPEVIEKGKKPEEEEK